LEDTEPIYGTKYYARAMKPGELLYWGRDMTLDHRLTLPAPNPYIPKDLRVIKVPSEAWRNLEILKS